MNSKLVVATTTNPGEYLENILKRVGRTGIVVTEVEENELKLDKIIEINPKVVFFEVNDNNEDSFTEVLKSLQEKNLTRDIAVFPLLKNLSDNDVENWLELGAADVLSVVDKIDYTMIKIDQVLGSGLAQAATDIDITPEVVPSAAPGVKVLVVEDDPLLKNLLMSKLSQSNIDTCFIAETKNFIPEIKAYQPSLVVLDIMLPGANGLDLLAEMRTVSEFKDTPVIIFSNRDEQVDRKRAADLGAKQYFVKAMTELSQLVRKIEELVA